MIAKRIFSLQHPQVQLCQRLREDKKARYQEKKVVISGNKMVQEIAAKFPLISLFVEETAQIPPFGSEECFLVSFPLLKKITGLVHPEPIAALVSLPPFFDLGNSRLLLCLDGISDPGNLGTLLRTAYSLGWDGALLTSSCTDPFNDKALRSAKGASFFLKMQSIERDNLFSFIEKYRYFVLIADAAGSPLSCFEQKIQGRPCMLILGNESQGISVDLRERFSKVSIPIRQEANSLNVAAAGAILMYTIGMSTNPKSVLNHSYEGLE